MNNIEIPVELLPDEQEVAFYREHGWYISKKIYSDEEIDQAREGMEAIYRGRLQRPADGPLRTFDFVWQFGPGLRKSDYASFFNGALARLVRKPVLAAIAARLAGTAEIRLWHDQLLYKPSQRDNPPASVGWHTDRMYWKSCSSDNMLTAWIPFHDADETIGTITMIDGSHSWPDNSSDLNFFSSDLEGLEARFKTGGAGIKKVPMLLHKGQVSFHNCLTIHGSGPNLTAQPRRSIAVHLQDKANHYRRFHYPDGTLAGHENDNLTKDKQGRPDYGNPQVCPVLFRRKN